MRNSGQVGLGWYLFILGMIVLPVGSPAPEHPKPGPIDHILAGPAPRGLNIEWTMVQGMELERRGFETEAVAAGKSERDAYRESVLQVAKRRYVVSFNSRRERPNLALEMERDSQFIARGKFLHLHTDHFLDQQPAVTEVFDLYEKMWDNPQVSEKLLLKALSMEDATAQDYVWALFGYLLRRSEGERRRIIADRLPEYQKKLIREDPDGILALGSLVRALGTPVNAAWLVRDRDPMVACRALAVDVMGAVADHPNKEGAVEALKGGLGRYVPAEIAEVSEAYLAEVLADRPDLVEKIAAYSELTEKLRRGWTRREVLRRGSAPALPAPNPPAPESEAAEQSEQGSPSQGAKSTLRPGQVRATTDESIVREMLLRETMKSLRENYRRDQELEAAEEAKKGCIRKVLGAALRLFGKR